MSLQPAGRNVKWILLSVFACGKTELPLLTIFAPGPRLSAVYPPESVAIVPRTSRTGMMHEMVPPSEYCGLPIAFSDSSGLRMVFLANLALNKRPHLAPCVLYGVLEARCSFYPVKRRANFFSVLFRSRVSMESSVFTHFPRSANKKAARLSLRLSCFVSLSSIIPQCTGSNKPQIGSTFQKCSLFS